MFNISNRKKELILAAEELQKILFGKRIRSLEQKYGEKEYRRKVVDIFEKLAFQWNLFHDNEAASLGVCYLYSSLLMRTYKFKIILLGKEFWLEEEPEEIVWDLASFFESFEKDMKLVLSRMENIFPRFCKAEEDAVRLYCAEYYLAAICQLCRDLAWEILSSDEMKELKKTEDFYIFFGRFLGEGEILWRMDNSTVRDGK